MSEADIDDDLPEDIDEAADEALVPFYDVYYHPQQGGRVRAGVLDEDEEIQQTFVSTSGLSIQRTGQAAEIARGWVAEQLAAIYQTENGQEADEK